MKEFQFRVDEERYWTLINFLEDGTRDRLTIKQYESIGEFTHPDYIMQRRELNLYRKFADHFYGAFPDIKPPGREGK